MVLRKAAGRLILWYIRKLSVLQLKKINPVVVGIGGASGKTSTCMLASGILSQAYKVKQSHGKNSETGIPLSILGVEPKDYSSFDWVRIVFLALWKVIGDWEKYDIYVAEMGIDGPWEPKNMSYLLRILRPQVAALSNITWEHSEYFEKAVKEKDPQKRFNDILKKTAEEEIKLLLALDSSGTAILNLDDEIIASYQKDIRAKKITISTRRKGADIYGQTSFSFESFRMKIFFRKKSYVFSLPFPLPSHYAYSFLIALSVGVSRGISIEQGISYLEQNFSLPPGRFTLFDGIKNTKIIDSSYNNATIIPIMDILELLKTSKRRKVGIIGDMRELGSISKTLHQKLGKEIEESLDAGFLIGDAMVDYAKPVIKKEGFQAFRTFSEAKEEITKNIKNGDLILVKGSQNKLFLERAVEMLLANEDDKEKLCRRGEFWDRKRSQTP